MIEMTVSENTWASAPRNLILHDNEVHVWRISLSHFTSRLHSLKQLLSSDERDRADKYFFKKDQDSYIAARGILRKIISVYLKIEPEDLLFKYNKFGKPFLIQQEGRNDLQFNLSHSNGIVLYSFTRNRHVGIDIEYIRPEVVKNINMEHFLSSKEAAKLRNLPEDLKIKGFFNCWTRKEAYLKALGKGLSIHLDQFDAIPASKKFVQILKAQPDSTKSSCWSLYDLNVGSEYNAALVVEGTGWFLKCWDNDF
jgi:4'-phosphopantetheinyl transferase